MSLRVRATLSQEAYYLGGEVQFRLRFALDDDADAGGGASSSRATSSIAPHRVVVMHWCAAQLHGHISVEPRRDAALRGVEDVRAALQTRSSSGGARAAATAVAALGSGAPPTAELTDDQRLAMFSSKASQSSRTGGKSKTFRCIFASTPTVVASKVRVRSGGDATVCECSIPLPTTVGGNGRGQPLLPSSKCHLFRVHYVLSIGVCPGETSTSATRVLRIPFVVLAPPPSPLDGTRPSSLRSASASRAAPRVRLVPRSDELDAQAEYELQRLLEWRSGAGENEYSVRHPCSTALVVAAPLAPAMEDEGQDQGAARARGEAAAPHSSASRIAPSLPVTQVSRFNISKNGAPLVEIVLFSPRFRPGQLIFGALNFAAPRGDRDGCVACYCVTIGLERKERLAAQPGVSLITRDGGSDAAGAGAGEEVFAHDEIVETWHETVRDALRVPFQVQIPDEACAEFDSRLASVHWSLLFDFAIASRVSTVASTGSRAAVAMSATESLQWHCPIVVRSDDAPRYAKASAAPPSCDDLLLPTASGHLLFAVLGDNHNRAGGGK